LTDFATATHGLLSLGERLFAAGLAPAMAGDYSVLLKDGTIAITTAGARKGQLTSAQVIRITAEGAPLAAGTLSDDALLHPMIYALDPSAGAVLHTRSVHSTVLSRALAGQDEIVLQGFELLKIFPHITSPDGPVAIPLIDNAQDVTMLAARVRSLLRTRAPLLPIFLIRGHGLYTWGRTLAEAEVVAEGAEFLLACAWEEHKARR